MEECAVDDAEDPVKFREDLIRIDRTTLSLKLLTYQKEHFAEVAVDVSAYSRPRARLTRRTARRERMSNRSERSARERASRVSFVPLELFSGKDMRNHHPSRNERNASEIFENGFPSQRTDRQSNDMSSLFVALRGRAACRARFSGGGGDDNRSNDIPTPLFRRIRYGRRAVAPPRLRERPSVIGRFRTNGSEREIAAARMGED